MRSHAPAIQSAVASVDEIGTATQPTAALVSVENLRIAFPPWKAPVRIVEDVSYQVRAGETMGIVGKSGSGKTCPAWRS